MGSLQMQYNRGRQAVITNELCVPSFYYHRFALLDRDMTGELTACISFSSLPPRPPLLLVLLAALFPLDTFPIIPAFLRCAASTYVPLALSPFKLSPKPGR